MIAPSPRGLRATAGRVATPEPAAGHRNGIRAGLDGDGRRIENPEAGPVTADRDRDADREPLRVPGIDVLEGATQATGLDAHAGVEARVEVRPPAQCLRGNGVGLDGGALSGQLLLDHEAQEAGELRRAQERWSLQDEFQGIDHAAGRTSHLPSISDIEAFPVTTFLPVGADLAPLSPGTAGATGNSLLVYRLPTGTLV